MIEVDPSFWVQLPFGALTDNAATESELLAPKTSQGRHHAWRGDGPVRGHGGRQRRGRSVGYYAIKADHACSEWFLFCSFNKLVRNKSVPQNQPPDTCEKPSAQMFLIVGEWICFLTTTCRTNKGGSISLPSKAFMARPLFAKRPIPTRELMCEGCLIKLTEPDPLTNEICWDEDSQIRFVFLIVWFLV